MTPGFGPASSRRGHPSGGLSAFRGASVGSGGTRRPGLHVGRPAAVASVLLLAWGCLPSPDGPRPPPTADLTGLTAGAPAASPRPSLEAWRDARFVVGDASLPAVGRFAAFAAEGEGSWVLFGVSLAPRSLDFQRVDGGWRARYQVRLEATRDGSEPLELVREEEVLVPSRREAERTVDAVLFQAALPLDPGEWRVRVRIRDVRSGRGFSHSRALRVPARSVPSLSDVVLVLDGGGPRGLAEIPGLVADPRTTAVWGQGPARFQVEGYGLPEGAQVRLQVVQDGAGAVAVAEAPVPAPGAGRVARAELVVDSDALPPGAAEVVAQAVVGGEAIGAPSRAPLVVAPGAGWVVPTFQAALEVIEPLAAPGEIEALRRSRGTERARLWLAFWEDRDPVASTVRNEGLERFVRRVAVADVRFGEAGVEGWRTDRGRTILVLGEPTREEAHPADGGALREAVVWVYEAVPGVGRLVLRFEDDGGYGRLRLTPASRADFLEAAAAVRSGPEAFAPVP